MTPAEQMAERLDEHAAQSGEYPTDYDTVMCKDAAAMIRRLSAALVTFHALCVADAGTDEITSAIEVHLDALRAAGANV